MSRLLLVTTSYPDGNEGEAAAGGFVQDFAQALTENGVAVEVVAPSLIDRQTIESGVEVRRFAVPRLPLSLLNPASLRNWKAITATLVKGSRAVMEACEVSRPDHILALWALPSGAWARRAGRCYGIPYSTWSLGSDIWTLGGIPVIRAFLRRVLRDASYRYADGYGLATQVEEISDLPCVFLPSSRRLPRRSRTEWRKNGPCRLAYLGRWHENKGVDLLLGALSVLGGEDWARIEAVRIHGGGPLAERVNGAVRALQSAGKNIILGGYLDRESACELFAWADYLIIPSRIESIPVVFSDAMQAGCPVIATPVGDLPRLIESLSCGILAEATNEAAIAEAIRKALNQPVAGFRMAQARSAAMFDVETTARRFLAMIGLQREDW